MLALVVTTIGCDRLTKHVARTSLQGTPGRSFLMDTVRFEYMENPGGFLSAGETFNPAIRTVIFTIGAGLLLIGMLAVAIRRRWTGAPLIGVVLICAGGASNLIDRVAVGRVVDFLNIGVGSLRTGIFNVADIALMLGACVFVLTYREPGARPDD